MSGSSLFPLFADLRDRRVLVVGAGVVAARKIDALLHAGARIEVVAADLSEPVRAWVRQGRLVAIGDRFQASHLEGAWLVVAATDDRAVNAEVSTEAEARRIFCNVVDAAELCSVQVPAVIARGPIQVAVSSGGAAPVLARQVRERIEQVLDDALGPLATLIGRWKTRIRARLPEVPVRRRFLETLLDGEVGDWLRRGRDARAEAALAEALARAESRPPGRVSLVGAGPGDPGLLSLKALRRLQEADVILYDRLVGSAILALARRDAERIEVGKSAGSPCTAQDVINRRLLEHAQAGLRVVRLKGGDPFIFGRGGEELAYLRGHGIACEVVPGITAAAACAAYAGIPLTHRDHAQSLRLVTGHCRDSLDTLDWRALAEERQTLAIYMAVGRLDTVSARLIGHGRDPDTPFALIENGTRPEQRVLLGRLADLAERARAHDVRSPAMLIIGEVAALAQSLHWFGAPPVSAPEPTARSVPLDAAA